MDKSYYVYLMTNPLNKVIYVGITNNLIRRVYEHKQKLVQGFTSKYNVVKLVYFESTNDVRSAISREKQLKAGPRKNKLFLITSTNPQWKDLYDELF